ncbi:YciE/YciF ferroxidase family protein [Halostagnicola kamekurae]|uniref:Ferritin-like metal-binding protein YciE n=1 Tax=Halostagnicola kamekurae TaxID=619731 RepID=A0A1I6P637_9EURY|nr:DUF892 family protein [Halostagnicola kamekurae]SFS35649.1 Ferritin-like metal-binding protein YciE [Halostagnicola kamekurae]
MTIESERQLFERKLEEYYGVQNALDDLQPELASNATDQDVADFFASHHEATRAQRDRAEDVFDAINAEPSGRDPATLEGILEVHEAVVADIERSDLADFETTETGKAVERLEITQLEALLVLADRIDLDADGTDALEQNKLEAEDGLETLRDLSESY